MDAVAVALVWDLTLDAFATTYTTTTAGNFEAQVKVSPKAGVAAALVRIAGYSQTTISAGVIDVARTYAAGGGVGSTPMSAGVQSTFTIFAADRYGNRINVGGVLFSISGGAR